MSKKKINRETQVAVTVTAERIIDRANQEVDDGPDFEEGLMRIVDAEAKSRKLPKADRLLAIVCWRVG